MNSEELKSIGISTGLILANIALMAIIALTPLSQITDILFSIPIIGMIIFGAGLTGGKWLARKGIRRNNTSTATKGTGLLQITYGIFGGGILAQVPANAFPLVLGITAIITTGIAVLAAVLVYGTGKRFKAWERYSNYLFMAALGTGMIGTLFPPLLLVTFILVLVGFMVYLVFEIWRMKQRPRRTLLNRIGIYIAYMGVFVQILQILLSDE